MDALARELRMDPVELRRRNLIPADRHPYATGLNTAGRGPVDYDSGDYPRCMDLALEALDMPAARKEQARLREQGRYLGIGVVNYVEATATVPNECACIRTARSPWSAAPRRRGRGTSRCSRAWSAGSSGWIPTRSRC
jgi:carbon-monoxide dehydrogenase large subunit